jgi:HTH-type transcriptional regulator / antitoxin HigA
MSWNVLKTTAAYKKAIKRTMEIFDALPGSAEEKELDLLLVLIKDYEDRNYVLPDLDPIEVIKLKMEENGIKSRDLEPLIGSRGHVSSVLSGRRELTLTMAQRLKNYFGLPAEVFMPNRTRTDRKKEKKVYARQTPQIRTKKRVRAQVA